MGKHKHNRGHDRKIGTNSASYSIDFTELNTPEKIKAWNLFINNECSMGKVIKEFSLNISEWKADGFLALLQSYNGDGARPVSDNIKKNAK